MQEWRISFEQLDSDLKWQPVSQVIDSERAMLKAMEELRSSASVRQLRLERRIVSNWLRVPGRWSLR